jgi:hypothetical protein
VAKAGATPAIVDTLLASDEPSIVWKTRVHVLGQSSTSKTNQALAKAVQSSPRVKKLLQHRNNSGQIACAKGVYAKWQGAHWILATLSDLGYPPGDRALFGARDQLLDAWLDRSFYTEFEAKTKADAYKGEGGVIMQGRHRRCASQQGYAIYYLLKLGLEHPRIHDLVERLIHWRWPDGGWNCDKEPSAKKSTFIHTLHCMRGLRRYGTHYSDKKALKAAREAAEIFLTRHLFKRASTGKVIRDEFTRLHYPLYWHYDILFALKALGELELLGDKRCQDALDLLEKKRLKDGGFPAERRYYKVSQSIALGNDFVDWGGTSKTRMNPWVTVDALAVLRQAGRI